MSSHLFILGRTPDLAFLELKTFFPDIKRLTPDVALSEIQLPVEPRALIARLGGTVKIAESIGTADSLEANAIASYVDKTGRVVFGVSVYGEQRNASRSLLEDAKALLEGGGSSVRFVEGKDGELSSVVIEKNKAQEIIFVKVLEGYIVGRTIAVQPFESWASRDFGRPYADPKAGMLPPKVSRMAVNVADGSRDVKHALTQKTLLDPFCGMGTVLAEALVMGWNVAGSDQSKDIIEKCRANLRWLTQLHLCADGVTYRLQSADAVHASESIDAGSIDAIVTEPFMGDTNIVTRTSRVGPQEVKNIMKGLEKLYIGCLKDWHKVLKPHGVIMIALPEYAINGKTYFVKKVIDMCETLGYTMQAGPIEYSRPQAVVKRQFFLFQKV